MKRMLIEKFTLPKECAGARCHKRPREIVAQVIWGGVSEPSISIRAVCTAHAERLEELLQSSYQSTVDQQPTQCESCGGRLSDSQISVTHERLCKICQDVSAGLRCAECHAPTELCGCEAVVH